MCQNRKRTSLRMLGLVYLLVWLCPSYYSRETRCDLRGPDNGLTLIEILIVVAIITIAARVLVPRVGSAGSLQVRSAADMSAADIEYAQSIAIGKGQNFSVVFDSTAEVKLGHFGSPYSSGGGTVMTISVEPVTGFVSIANRCG